MTSRLPVVILRKTTLISETAGRRTSIVQTSREPGKSRDTATLTKMSCAYSEDSSQPAHPCSLIRIFAARIKSFDPLVTPRSWQRKYFTLYVLLWPGRNRTPRHYNYRQTETTSIFRTYYIEHIHYHDYVTIVLRQVEQNAICSVLMARLV